MVCFARHFGVGVLLSLLLKVFIVLILKTHKRVNGKLLLLDLVEMGPTTKYKYLYGM